MRRFNLSQWALANRELVTFFMALLGVIGTLSYFELGRSEDPPFTFRVMVVRAFWPGATPDEVDRLVTDRIEEKLQGLGAIDYLRSYSRPGESQVFVIFRDDGDPKQVSEHYYQVRKKINDIRHRFPVGVQGPFFDDEFGDTFGNIYALQGPDFTYEELRDYADQIKERLLRVPDVAKVELLGLQQERLFIDLTNARRSRLKIPAAVLVDALQSQNAVLAAGDFSTQTDRIHVRVSGNLETVDQLHDLPIRYQGRTFRLGDIAEVHRGYQDPPAPRVHFNGEPALGIAVSMHKGGNIVRLGQALDAEFAALTQDVPLGMRLSKLADQPAAVTRGVGEFVKVLAEAVVIVLAVSFLSLGVRTGLVVALSIPLVLAMTFAAMHYFNIDLHKISLGSLVLALGLLVDDAIIAVEMMSVKLEEGMDRIKAAAFTYTSTAFPMLSGTVVTAAGFLPIATAASSTGEYTRSIFQVVTIALLLSWIAAVMFVPLLGYWLLPAKRRATKSGMGEDDGLYQTPFYKRFRGIVEFCINRRWTTIIATVAIFIASLGLFAVVPQQFFPSSTRLELMVDLKLAEGASIQATEAAVERFEALIQDRPGIKSYASYVGSGSPRFFLSLDLQLPASSFAQFVINTNDIHSREEIRAWLLEQMPRHFPDLRWRINRLENGPPVGYVLQYRISGPDVDVARRQAQKIADLMRANPHPAAVHLDTAEKSKVIRVEIDQDRARALGVSTRSVSDFLQTSIRGTQLSAMRENNRLVGIELRGARSERAAIERLSSLSVPTDTGANIPLSQIARLSVDFEEGILWRRDRMPTVTARADIYSDIQPPQVVAQLAPAVEAIRSQLPRGYRLEVGGTVEDAARGQKSVNAGMPLFLLVVVTVLMLQLKRLSLVAMVLLTAPLGLIGVPAFLLMFGKPFGFVAMLGTIALFGMIMRNTVILVDQIDQNLKSGLTSFEAISQATVRRFRPIVLTAATAMLAMVPLSTSVFFGPQAVAIMGGLIAATGLTLLFVPALYAAWFRVPRQLGPVTTPRAS